MKSKGLSVTTRFNQNRVLTLAGMSFFSKRLNGEEEMTLQDLQLEASTAEPAQALANEVDFIADLLRFRAVNDTEREKVTRELLLEKMGKFTSVMLLNYLRSGVGIKPGETLDLPIFSDPEDPEDNGTLTIEDRVFTQRALNYAEALEAAAQTANTDALSLARDAQGLIDRANGLGQITLEQVDTAAGVGEEIDFEAELQKSMDEGRSILAQAKRLTRMSADVLAGYLNARLLEGEPITGAWLLQNVTDGDIGAIVGYLTNGEIEVPDEETQAESGPKLNAPVSA